MATLAPPNLFKMYKIIGPYLKSLRIGGIVGDTAHVAGGGYHISREDLRAHGQGSDYSIQAPADKRGASNYAAAIDISLDPVEMVLVSKRLKAAMEGVNYDDRIEPLREFIGTVDNRNVCGFNRYRTSATSRPTGWYASGYSESSHLWHVHLSFFRDYCNDQNSILGAAEVVCGLKAGALGWKPTGTGKPNVGNGRPVPILPPAKTGPHGERLYVMWTTHNGTKGYKKPPAVGKVRYVRKKGFRVVGYVVKRSDGRYLRTTFGTDYPLDSLTHDKPKN